MKIKKFIRFMDGVIEQLARDHKLGTLHVYKYALKAFRSFIKAEGCWGRSLDVGLIKEFEVCMERRSLSLGTSGTYMRMLRATYNRAAKLNQVGVYNRYLFDGVYTGTDSVVKRALSAETMGQVLLTDERELPDALPLTCACFKLMLMLRGIPFSDLAHLRKCDYKDGVITYCRYKTNRWMAVKVPADARILLERYANTDANTPYLLPLLGYVGNDVAEEHRLYLLALGRFNYRLPLVGSALKIDVKLSSYTARHTWATAACMQGTSIDLVCDAMGHSSPRVTKRYVKPFEEKKINEMNESLINYVKQKAMEKMRDQ